MEQFLILTDYRSFHLFVNVIYKSRLIFKLYIELKFIIYSHKFKCLLCKEMFLCTVDSKRTMTKI